MAGWHLRGVLVVISDFCQDFVAITDGQRGRCHGSVPTYVHPSLVNAACFLDRVMYFIDQSDELCIGGKLFGLCTKE